MVDTLFTAMRLRTAVAVSSDWQPNHIEDVVVDLEQIGVMNAGSPAEIPAERRCGRLMLDLSGT